MSYFESTYSIRVFRDDEEVRAMEVVSRRTIPALKQQAESLEVHMWRREIVATGIPVEYADAMMGKVVAKVTVLPERSSYTLGA